MAVSLYNPLSKYCPEELVEAMLTHPSSSGYQGANDDLTCGLDAQQREIQRSAQWAKPIFHAIKTRKTAIQYLDSSYLEPAIEQLLTCPSGRVLLSTLAKSPYPICIQLSHRNIALKKHNMIVIELNPSEVENLVLKDSSGNRFLGTSHLVTRLAHELIHGMQFLWNIDNYSLHSAPPKYSIYTNLAEQLTIHGAHGYPILCENMIRYELGLPERVGHLTSLYPSIESLNQLDLYWIPTTVYFGLLEEIKKGIKQGRVDPYLTFWFAAKFEEYDIYCYLLEEEQLDIQKAFDLSVEALNPSLAIILIGMGAKITDFHLKLIDRDSNHKHYKPMKQLIYSHLISNKY